VDPDAAFTVSDGEVGLTSDEKQPVNKNNAETARQDASNFIVRDTIN
jgi:hypothetical protein